MAWYNDRADQFEQNEESKRRGKELAQQVNHWSKLRVRVERDINGINQDHRWARQLGGLPLVVQDAQDLASYQISKLGVPKLDVIFRHEGDHVIIERKFYGKPLPGYSNRPERLDLVELEGRLFLQRADDKKRFDMPEEMSQYLLEPFIQVLEGKGYQEPSVP